MPEKLSVSFEEIRASGIPLLHAEAVAIARSVAQLVIDGALPGIPAPANLRLYADGRIHVDGRPREGRLVERAACLLEVLLTDAVSDAAAPAAFRLIVARAYANDAAGYESLRQFIDALAPFGSPDGADVVREVFSRYLAATAAHDSLHDQALFAPESQLPARVNGESLPDTFGLDEFAPEPEQEDEPILRPARDRRHSFHPTDRPKWPIKVRSAQMVVGIVIGLTLLTLVGALEWRSRGSRSQQTQGGAAVESVPAEPIASISEPSPAADAAPPTSDARLSPRPEIRRATRSGMTARGSLREVLAHDAFSPAFASASSAMFYHSGMGADSAIMRADTDGAGGVLRVMSVVSDRGSNFHPRPSPDGRSIAFDSDRDGERGVYVADANGRGVRRISGPGFAAVPSWSPDGRQLAFVRAEEGRPRVWNLWTLDVATGKASRITSHRYGQPWGAAWFPQSDRIAYSHETSLIIRTLDGKDQRTFSSPVRGRLVRTPAVSPDGKRIIFQVRHDGAWMLDVDSGSMYRVLEDPSAEEFTWSADGRRVAYHSRRSGNWGVWVMAPR